MKIGLIKGLSNNFMVSRTRNKTRTNLKVLMRLKQYITFTKKASLVKILYFRQRVIKIKDLAC